MSVEKKTMTDLCHSTGTIDGRSCPGCDECPHGQACQCNDCVVDAGILGILLHDEDEDDGPCWCGVENPHYEDLPLRCGGDGVLRCECGGDFCVCHWHGEVECDGCEDCEGFDDGDTDCDDEHDWNEDVENWECEP